jgi:hypothetical protein
MRGTLVKELLLTLNDIYELQYLNTKFFAIRRLGQLRLA